MTSLLQLLPQIAAGTSYLALDRSWCHSSLSEPVLQDNSTEGIKATMQRFMGLLQAADARAARAPGRGQQGERPGLLCV